MTTDSQNTKQDPSEKTTTNKRLEQHLQTPLPSPSPPPPPRPLHATSNNKGSFSSGLKKKKMKKKGDIHSREVMKSKGPLLVVTVEDVTLCTQLFRERL